MRPIFPAMAFSRFSLFLHLAGHYPVAIFIPKLGKEKVVNRGEQIISGKN